MSLHIEGLQTLQAAIQRTQSAVRPRGAFGEAIKAATIHLHRYATTITHVDTGTLRAGHTMRFGSSHGEIYISPSAVNPRTGQSAARYGVFENARGGSHAFYDRTINEAGGYARGAAAQVLRRGLP